MVHKALAVQPVRQARELELQEVLDKAETGEMQRVVQQALALGEAEVILVAEVGLGIIQMVQDITVAAEEEGHRLSLRQAR